MAGLRGNIGWIMAQKQTAYGTLAVPAIPGAASGAFKTALTNGGIAPNRSVANLQETDSSRDQGVSYVQVEGSGGAPEFYVRDDNLGFWLMMALGADAVTGTTPNFVHTQTPANVLPYFSMWRDVSDTLWEAYQDCKCSSLVISAQAGSPLTCTATIAGRIVNRLTADPSLAPVIPMSSGYAYNFNDATITLSGGVTALVSGFTLTIDNGVNTQQTDNVAPFDVIEGTRVISMDFDLVFSTLNEYNAFHYGSTSGTVVSPTIYTTSCDFSFAHGANNNVEFSMPSIAYTEFPVDVNAAGNPITVAVKSVGQRGASPILTAIVKNQVQVY